MPTPSLTTAKGSPSPTSGQMPNAVVGIVEDNVDPEELGRIKVSFPTLGSQSFWIRQATPNGGSGRGFYSLPEKKDEVLVNFMLGDVNQGVIVNQMWNGTDKPPVEAKDGLPGPDKTDTGGTWSTDMFTAGSTDLANNDRRFWKSRSGHLMVFDDTDGAETVQIWDKTHSMAFVFDSTEGRVLLSNTTGDIHIRTKENLFIEAGKNIKWIAGENIEGESGKDTIHTAKKNYKLDATDNVETKSGKDTKVTAGKDMKLKATASMSLDCKMLKMSGTASVKMSSKGAVTIRGLTVSIN